MDVYIANESLQHREFHFRIPGRESASVVLIPAGRQERLPGNYDGSDLQNIIKQVEAAGGVPQSDLSAITRPHSLVYRVAKRIEVDTIDEARALDLEARQEIAAEKMEESGLRAFGSSQMTLAQNGVSPDSLRESTIELIETSDTPGPVKDGVNHEVTVSAKPGRAGRMKREEKRGPKR